MGKEKEECNKQDKTEIFSPFDGTKRVEFFCPEQCNPKCAVRGDCENEKNYQLDGKDCEKLKEKEKCNKQDERNMYSPFDGTKRVEFFCPEQCNTVCAVRGDCENEKDYQLNGKNCEKLKEKEKCNKQDTTNKYPPFDGTKRVEFFCPEQCNTVCSTNAPTDPPTNAPTPEPTP